MFNALKRFFGSANERLLKKYSKIVQQINALEPNFSTLSDEELRQKTEIFKQRLAQGEDLNDLLPEAFATVREAAKRVLGQRPYDVQLLGGMVLHYGMIAEMKTGEGKTLVATLPSYLNALSGKGVHVVTVNDYLARRDSEWMGQVHRFLGLKVDCILHNMSDLERREAYNADITYGTNNELGFDYLRDNMKFRIEEMVQRPFNYAIVDEVDSILIDEARTPLIISGPAEDSSELYIALDNLIPQLSPDDYEKDEKQRTVIFTEVGSEKIEQLLRDAGLLEGGNLYDIHNITLLHHANQALRAHKLFTKDVDYIVKDNKVIIIDEFTGRMMDGRRYSEGLHQALEAKERVEIQKENQTLASITFQNYFRLYPKLSGMTGTAMTEAAELGDIYNLEVVEIPTHVPVVRKDYDDEIYRTNKEKYEAILKLIQECRDRNQPVLVGTTSIEKSEELSALLKKHKIPHNVLNARHHEQEAKIVEEAGLPGAITIATNMAGRGTDIKLGGNLERLLEEGLKGLEGAAREKKAGEIKDQFKANEAKVRAAGGLYIIGTERHESRRIDNQLRGRAGRQPGEAITHPWINKALIKAQQKVEARNYDIRKHLLKYDDVMNDQRKVIYEQRRELMTSESVKEVIKEMRDDAIIAMAGRHIPFQAYPDQWDVKGLHDECLRLLNKDLPIAEWAQEEGIAGPQIQDRLLKVGDEVMQEKEEQYGTETLRLVEKSFLLRLLDQTWKNHLLALDHLRQGINLRAYGQRDPLNEYKREAFMMFEDMLDELRDSVTSVLAHLNIQSNVGDLLMEEDEPQEMHETRLDPAFAEEGTADSQGSAPHRTRQASEHVNPRDPSTWGRVRRNEACPCGSGEKYKSCHGKV